ncbi:MAG TPA: PAS domain-containing sensor histidine kinase [Gaiellaceae bacterium]
MDLRRLWPGRLLAAHLAAVAAGTAVWAVGRPGIGLLLAAGGGVAGHVLAKARLRGEASALEARYQRLVEEIPLTLYISSLDQRSGAVYVSPAIEQLLGYPLSAWAGNRHLFETLLHPDDSERVNAAIARSKREGTPHAEEYRLIAHDGGVVWVQDRAVTVRDKRGRPLYWQGFLVDVTARKQAEARFRSLAEQLPLITYVDSPTDAHSTASYISPQVEQILGYPIDAWSSPGFFLAHVHPEDRERVAREQRAARESGTSLELEYRFVAADGRTIWLRDSYTVVNDEAGRPWYTQGFALDVTERKQAERDREALLAQTQEQNEQLQQVDRMKDEFIALVSHELRTPLTSICGYLELLTGDIGDAHAESIAVIERNAGRLLRLVEDLLLTAQVTAGNLALTLADLDVNEVVAHSVETAKPVAAARGIELVAGTCSAPTIVNGDRMRIGQVVDNLVANALKFTPAGGRVDVRAVRSDGMATIAVTDTGPGIDPEDQEHVFGRFFRTDRAQRDAVPGVGLGLAIARAIVDGHDGAIRVASTPGEGTTFVVELPLAA